MEKVVFDGDNFKKTSFFFISGVDYKALDEAKLGKEIEIAVRDNHGNDVTIAFEVTRNAYLGERQHWLYGSVRSTDGIYRQIEIRRNKDKPHLDRVDVFPQAPPLLIQKLR